jgi:hypothetical protein
VLGRVDALRQAAAPASRAVDPHELRRRGAAALRELLGRIAAEYRLVLFIDDLQWGDADSATLLRELLDAPFAPALLFVGAYRSDAREGSEFVRAVRALTEEATLPLQTLLLGPMAEGEAHELAQALLGERGGDGLAARIAREAAGMPLFVRELSAQAREGLLGGLPPGSALAAAIARRVQTLPAPAQAVLELVSIAHAPLPEALILSAAQLGEGAPTVVRTLGAQWLLRVGSDGRLDAYHDRVRETVAEQIAAERRCALHGALAQALQRDTRTAPDVLAAHALAGGLTELGLAATLQAASEAMQKLAFERAAAHLRSALSLLAHPDPRRDAALVQLGEALRLDGRGREAGDAYVQAAERTSGLLRLERLRKASSLYLSSAYVDRGIDVMLPVLQTLGVTFPRSAAAVRAATLGELVRVHALRPFFRERSEAEIDETVLARIDACYALGTGLLSVWERRRFALFLLRALRLALQTGAARRAAYIDVAIASMPSGPRQLETRSQPIFDHAHRLARRHGDGELEGWTYTNSAMAFLWAMRPEPAIEHALLASRCLGAAGVRGIALGGAEHALRLGLMLAGRMAELATASVEHVRSGRARSDLFCWTAARANGALATLAADEPERALDELRDALESFAAGQHWRRWRDDSGLSQNAALAALIRCWVLIYRRDGAGALAALSESWPGLRRAGYFSAPCWNMLFVWSRGAAALAAARATGTPGAPPREVRRAQAALSRIATQPIAPAFVQLLQAGVAGLAGDLTAARAALGAAADAFDAVHMQLFAAPARRRIGELTDGDAGKTLRDAADAHMRALGVVSPERWTAMYTPGLPPAA